ncbi:MAG: double-strand break repair protein AddB [Bauldia sp.]
MAEPRPPNVFTIPAGTPFLPTLAEALLSGALVPLPGADPLALAGVTVLLPTRRAARAFTDVLAGRLGRDAAILPTVRPIGDIDEDEALLDPMIEPLADRLTLPAAISALTRKLALTRLTLGWASGFRGKILGLRPGEPLRVAASAADALRLAGDLARLVDDMATADVGWEKIRTLVPDDHAEYFQLTLEFLEIVSHAWPQYLRDNDRADPAARRDTLLRSAAARLKQHGSPGPIVAAGSTGSMPATAALLAEIARLPNGAVVLPGLDQTLDARGWHAIGGDDGPAAAHGHPQFALKHLIGRMGVARDAVTPLGDAPDGGARVRLLSEASRPAETLDAWAGYTPPPAALDGVDLLVARNEQEEATAIALAIREAVEKPGVTVGLVTPDRTLARRVAAELGRWGLAVDDSAGAPLANEPHGIFARLLAEAAVSDADPLKLASLLKHRFASFGLSRDTCRQAAATLEVALFRGRLASGGIAGLPAVLERTRAETLTEKNVPLARRRLDPSQWKLAANLVAALTDCLGPIAEVMRKGVPIALADAAGLLAAALAKAAADETGGDAALWHDAGGNALATLLDDLVDDHEAANLMLAPADIPFVFGALFADEKVTRPAGDDPRVHIWGTLEARLQTVDCLILGGLDEGVWPSATRTDPWLSRAMRAAIGLSPPERRLGLAAHDFFEGLAAPRVIVSRAEKRGGAATVESRWLQLIRVLIGKEEADRLAARGARYVALARALDAAPDKPRPTRRPEPKPPVAARPKHLSITEIETLIRDPYAIYARRILKLEPLDPLGRAPDGALRGTLIHDALGKFTAAWSGAYDTAAEVRLREIGREALRAVEDFPDVHAVWSLRFDAIAHWFASWEAARAAAVEKRHAEIDGKLVVPVPGGEFTLRGRADRIDLMANGKVAIYDFKTGSPQTERTVFAGLTPQMTLEAAMVRAGGFPDVPAALSVADLAWLAVGRAGRQDPYVNAVRRGETADDLADKAHAMLIELVTAFADPGRPYVSRARPMMERARYIGDYDHLARVREWALVESEADVDIFGSATP